MICEIWPDEWMPHDENGNRADVAVYGVSTFNRMNGGRFFEQYFNAANRDLAQKLRVEAGLDRHLPPTSHELEMAVTKDPTWTKNAFDRLIEYYGMTVPNQAEDLRGHPVPEQHVYHVLKDGIYLNHPPDNPISPMDQVRAVMKSPYCPHYGKVTYRNSEGGFETSKSNMLIGALYMIPLEKTGDDWSAGASVKTQHFGVPAKMNQHDRNTSPAKETAVRGLGEAETRSWNTTVGPGPTMELMDQSSNPRAHRFGIHNILTHRTPTHIDRLVDRKVVPYGGSKPVNLVDNILGGRGIKLVYRPDQ